MEKNLGHATAYGYAKSKGYSGTEDEFAQLMADYASVGQSAAQSAEQAAASATSASGSAATAASAAQTATSKASEAVTAAGTATTKASDAQASAESASASAGTASEAKETAVAKADEASGYAQTATDKAGEAQQSAQTATVKAGEAAQSASAAAESARTLTIDDTLTQAGQAADAKETGDKITGLKEDLNNIKDYVDITSLFNKMEGYRYYNNHPVEASGYDFYWIPNTGFSSIRVRTTVNNAATNPVGFFSASTMIAATGFGAVTATTFSSMQTYDIEVPKGAFIIAVGIKTTAIILAPIIELKRDEYIAIQKNGSTSIIPAFDTTQDYIKGNVVIYDKVLYKFTLDKSAGSWDATKAYIISENELGLQDSINLCDVTENAFIDESGNIAITNDTSVYTFRPSETNKYCRIKTVETTNRYPRIAFYSGDADADHLISVVKNELSSGTSGYEDYFVNIPSGCKLVAVMCLKTNFPIIMTSTDGFISFNSNRSDGASTDTAYSYNGYVARESLPSYYKSLPASPVSYDDDSYIDVKLSKIPNGRSFVFLTDTHRESNASISIPLIQCVNAIKELGAVINGGDYLDAENTKYLAKQVILSEMMESRLAFGNKFLPVYGNHDTNMANTSKDKEEHYLPPSVFVNMALGSLNQIILHDYSAKIAALDATNTQKAEIAEYLKMTYAIDDHKNKIRYIIFNTGNPAYGVIYDVFELYGQGEVTLQFDALYDYMVNTPEGYDVCCVSHFIGIPHTGSIQYVCARVAHLLMGLKLKVNRRIYNSSERNENLSAWYGPSTQYFDFTNANDVGRVFMISAHVHYDFTGIVNCVNSDTSCAVTEYDGVSVIDQSEDGGYNNIPIPCIWTTTNAYGRYRDPLSIGIPEERLTVMEQGTVTEQAFDVITLVDDGIAVTRIGAGDDRKILMS